MKQKIRAASGAEAALIALVSDKPDRDLKYVFPQFSGLGAEADQRPFPSFFVGHLIQYCEGSGLIRCDFSTLFDLNGVEDAVLLND